MKELKISGRATLYIVTAILLPACTSIFSGNSRPLTILTNPTAARCDLLSQGKILSSVETTPGVASTSNTDQDVDIICRKNNFDPSNGGSTLFGAIIGFVGKAATAGGNHSPETITINLAAIPTNGRASTTLDQQLTSMRQQEEEFKMKLEALKKLRKDNLISLSEFKKKRSELISKY